MKTLETEQAISEHDDEDGSPGAQDRPKAGSGDSPDTLVVLKPEREPFSIEPKAVAPLDLLPGESEICASDARDTATGPDTGASPSAQKVSAVLSTSQESARQ